MYVHRDYERMFPLAIRLKKYIPSSFDYTIIKVNAKAETVSFIECPTFDELDESLVGTSLNVKTDGTYKVTSPLDDPWIYHHKWMMVAPSYQGFDYEASRKRSQAWSHLDVNKSRIGRKSYWDKNVVPLIGVDKQSSM